MDWYYRKKHAPDTGAIHGPVQAKHIIDLARSGRLDPDDDIRVGARGQWRKVATMPGLRASWARQPAERLRQLASIPVQKATPVVSDHWAGSQSLALSFWGYFLLPLAVLQLVIVLGVQLHWPVTFLAMLAAVSLVLLPWQFIGTWRASERHRVNHRDASPALAEAGMIVGALAVFLSVAWNLPYFIPRSPPFTSARVLPVTVASIPKPAHNSTPKPAQVLESDAASTNTLSESVSSKPTPVEKPVNSSDEPIKRSESAPAVEQTTPVKPLSERETWRAEIVAENGLTLLQTSAPEAWKYVEQALDGVLSTRPTTKAQVWRWVDQAIQEVAIQSIASANDAVILRFAAAQVEELQALEKKGAEYCMRKAYPEGNPAGKPLPIPENLRERMRASMIELILNGYKRKAQKVSGESVTPTLHRVYHKLSARYGNAIYDLDKIGANGFDAATQCRITIEIYEAFLALPAEIRGPLLRFTFAEAPASG